MNTPHHTWPALIDEGASRVSLVSKETCVTLAVELCNISPVQLKPFSGKLTVTATACATLHFTLGSFSTVHSWLFLVVDSLPYQFILGRDWKVAARVLTDEPVALYVRQQTSACAINLVDCDVPSIAEMRTKRCDLMQKKLDKQTNYLRDAYAKIGEIGRAHV